MRKDWKLQKLILLRSGFLSCAAACLLTLTLINREFVEGLKIYTIKIFQKTVHAVLVHDF